MKHFKLTAEVVAGRLHVEMMDASETFGPAGALAFMRCVEAGYDLAKLVEDLVASGAREDLATADRILSSLDGENLVVPVRVPVPTEEDN